jgi:hypothetical protein
MPALTQHVCFPCRKVFKKPTRYSSSTSRRTSPVQFPPYICPQCNGALVNMGHKFRAPRATDVKEWARIAGCVANGVAYGTPTRRKPTKALPGAPAITPALKKTLGHNPKWKAPRKRRKGEG